MAYNSTNITETAPDWQAVGAEPPASLKNSGFLSGYKPPAAYFNWFWSKVSRLLSQIRTAVVAIQDYLTTHNSKVIITASSTVGYVQQLDTFYTNYHNGFNHNEEHIIVAFITTYSLFSGLGVPNGSYGELDCKTGVITFPEANVKVKRVASQSYSVLKAKHLDISDNSIPCSKLSDKVLKCVHIDNLTVNDISSISGEYEMYAQEDDDYYILFIPAGGTLAATAGDNVVKVDVHRAIAQIGAKVYKYGGSGWNLLS